MPAEATNRVARDTVTRAEKTSKTTRESAEVAAVREQQVEGEGGTDVSVYGGNEPEDNSGSLRYVRIAAGGLVARAVIARRRAAAQAQ